MAPLCWRSTSRSTSLEPVAILAIRTIGDQVLANRSTDIETFDAALQRLIDDMFETMYDAPGVGLAGPQVGVPKRIFVYDAGDGPEVFINPELVVADGEWVYEEGCLSVPSYWWEIRRPGHVVMRGLNRDGKPQQVEGEELLGRVLQHEFDHLEGRLLIERLTDEERRVFRRSMREKLIDS